MIPRGILAIARASGCASYASTDAGTGSDTDTDGSNAYASGEEMSAEPYDGPNLQSAQPIEGQPVVQTNYGPLDRSAVYAGRVAGAGSVSVQADPYLSGVALTSLNPSTIALGSPSTTLHVLGSGFTPSSVITFAGQVEPTTYVSPTEVTTGLDMSVWKGQDTVPVTVDGSAPLMFTFTAAEGRGRSRKEVA